MQKVLIVIFLIFLIEKTCVKASTFSPAFVNGFRRFWADTVDLATRLDDFTEDLDGDRFFEAAIDQPLADDRIGQVSEVIASELESHFKNLDNRDYFMILLKSPMHRLQELLTEANLFEWTQVLYRKVGDRETVERILNLYWRSSSLSEREYRFIISSIDGANSGGIFNNYLHSITQTMIRLLIDHFDITGRDTLFHQKMVSLALTIRHIIVNEVEVSDFINIRQVLLHPVIGLDLNSLPPDAQILFNSSIVGYFNSVGYSITGRMIASVLRLTSAESQDDTKLMISALNKCGPGMQKILQLVGKDAKSENLKTFLEHLKDSIEPMSDRERQLVIENALGGTGKIAHGFIPHWSSLKNQEIARIPVSMRLLELKHIVGSASIGEGWVARVHFSGKPLPENVFVKLMRWDVDRLMEKEIEFIETIQYEYPNLSDIIRELADGLKEETDFEAEAANQLLGHEMYDHQYNKRKNDFIYVPKPLGVFKNSRASIIVMPLEQGVTIKKALDEYLTVDNACAVVDLHVSFMRHWIAGLMVGNGMGHGDPHAGNVLIDFHRAPKYTSMIILDWGNVIRLSKIAQATIFRYATGIFAKDESVVLEGLGRPLRKVSDPTSDDPLKNHSHYKWLQLEREIVLLFSSLKRTLQLRRSLTRSQAASFNYDSVSSFSFSDDKLPATATIDHQDEGEESSQMDLFSLDSNAVKSKIIQDDGWGFGDSVIILLENVIAKAVTNGLKIPQGIAGMLRARRFMEDTLEKLAHHDAVREAGCRVPRPYSVFFQGILFKGGVNFQKASVGAQSTLHLMKAAKNNLRRRLKQMITFKRQLRDEEYGDSVSDLL